MHKPFIILAGGRYGAGKGTMIANFVANSGYRVLVIETGDLIRKLLTIFKEQRDSLSERHLQLVEEIQKTPAGKLVADWVVFELVTEKLKNTTDFDVIIFDGFPRNTAQTNWLVRTLTRLGLTINLVIEITLGHNIAQARKVAVQRIRQRAKEAGDNARKDDLNEATIKTRQDDYDREIGDTFKRFIGSQRLEIDGLQQKEVVSGQFDAIVSVCMFNRDIAA